MTENSTIPFEKTNKCNPRLRCTAENQDQQRECKYFFGSESGLTLGDCLSLGFYGDFPHRCCSPIAKSEALDKLINAVREQL